MSPPPPRRRAAYAALAVALALLAVEGALRVAAIAVLHRPQPSPHDDGALRILCIGDSYTFGIGTAPELYSWPMQLEALIGELNPGLAVEVVNEGVPGRSSPELLEELPAQLAELEPDLVCVLVGLNNAWSQRASGSSWLDLLRSLRTYRAIQVLVGRARLAAEGALSEGGPLDDPAGEPEPAQRTTSRVRIQSERLPHQTELVVSFEGERPRPPGHTSPGGAGPAKQGVTGQWPGAAGKPREQGPEERTEVTNAGESFFGGPASLGMGEDAWTRAAARLRRDLVPMAARVRASGAELVILTYPEAVEELTVAQRWAARELGAPLVDVGQAFRERAGSDELSAAGLISADGHHPNGAGYRVLAEAAYQGVRTALVGSGTSLRAPPAPGRGVAGPDYSSEAGAALLAEWKRKTEEESANPATLTRYALILADSGDEEGAIGILEGVVGDRPDHGLAASSLAHLYRQRGDVAAELDLCRRVLAARPGDPTFSDRLAVLEGRAPTRVGAPRSW